VKTYLTQSSQRAVRELIAQRRRKKHLMPEGPDGLTGGRVAASRPAVVGGKEIFF